MKVVRPAATEPLTKEQLEQKTRLEDLNGQFQRATDQWSIHNPDWQTKWARFADKYADTIPNAKRLLGLAKIQVAEKSEQG